MKKFALLLLTPLLLAACGQVPNNPACTYDELPEDQQQFLNEYSKTITMKIKPEKGDTIARMETNHGNIEMLLYTKEAPKTTKNFIELSKTGKYNDTIFHRVIDCFMIQGGDFEKSNGMGGHSYKGPGTTINDEFGEGLKHLRGAVSMANIGVPNTGGSQFFIVQADKGTPGLDGKHAVFGFVYEGMDVVDEIAAVETDPADRPPDPVRLNKVEILKY